MQLRVIITRLGAVKSVVYITTSIYVHWQGLIITNSVIMSCIVCILVLIIDLLSLSLRLVFGAFGIIGLLHMYMQLK